MTMADNNKEIIEKKVEAIDKELNKNILIAIGCICILVFIPILTFQNFMFKINLWTIIAFIGLASSIFRGNNLRSRKEEMLAELSVYEKKDKPVEPQKMEETFECTYCEKKFKSEIKFDDHFNKCKIRLEKNKQDRKIVLWTLYIGFTALIIFLSIIYVMS